MAQFEIRSAPDVASISSIAEIPAAEWAALEGGVCPLWSRALFDVMEGTSIGIDGFSYVTVRRSDRLVALLPIFWFTGFPLDDALGDPWRRRVSHLRRRFPRFARVSVLVCGHPLAEGRLLGDDLTPAEAASVMDELRRLASRHGLRWTVFKDFSAAALVERLPAVGRRPFIAAPAFPNAVIDLSEDLDAYLAGLKPKARRNARSKLRGFARDPALTIEVVEPWSVHVPQVVDLYEQVLARANMRFERLSPAFFEALAVADVGSWLIVCQDGDRIVGALVCLVAGPRCVSFRIGLDYDVAREHHLWFILQYEAVRVATSRGCRELDLMQSTYPPKRELGCRLDAPVHRLAHRSAALSALLSGGLSRALARSVEDALEGRTG